MIKIYPKVFAHRGASGYVTENTIAAMERAKLCGAEWVEFDVTVTASGTPVIFHDDDLKRLAHDPRSIPECTDAEVQNMRVTLPHDTKQHTIPTLTAMLSCLQALQLNANVELKELSVNQDENVQRIWNTINQNSNIEKLSLIFSSFELNMLHSLRKLAPKIDIAILLHRWRKDWLTFVEKLNPIAMHLNAHIMTPQRIAAIKAQNLLIAVYTVNDPTQARALYDLGVDAVFSDYPDRIKERA